MYNMSEFKICFVIANKYVRGYNTYIKTYVENINTFYKECFILIVDNNSNHFEEDIHFDYTNVKILTNVSDSKFELGAYNFGINYLLENNIANSYKYFIFTQDTFVLTKYYDFSNLLENNVMACPLVRSSEGLFFHEHTSGMPAHSNHKDFSLIRDVLSNLNLIDCANKLTFCWANSFVLNNNKLTDFLELTKNIKIDCKIHSECSERYLAGILYHLNNNISSSVEKIILDDFMYDIKFERGAIITLDYFIKYIHVKTELTKDE